MSKNYQPAEMDNPTGKINRQRAETATGRFIETQGDFPLTYEMLLYSLEHYYINAEMLHFASTMFSIELQKATNDEKHNIEHQIYLGDSKKFIEEGIYDPEHIHTKSLRSDMLPLLQRVRELGNKGIGDAITTVNFQNHHFIRTKFINSIYEIIEKYLARYEEQFSVYEARKIFLRERMQKQSWYAILNILRNTASHADGLNVKLTLPKFLKNKGITTVQWNNISVTEGMMSHAIRYNDEELRALYKEIYAWLVANFHTMTRDNKGNDLKDLHQT